MTKTGQPLGNSSLPDGFLIPFGVSLRPKRLRTALTHRSWAAEHPKSSHNERLEFLGDSVLGQIVSWRLYQEFPALSEGELSLRRAALVSSASLAFLARGINLGRHIKLGRGEKNSGGADKDSILADALEAIIGAVYEEHGHAVAERFVNKLIKPQFQKLDQLILFFDPKTTLQEEASARSIPRPSYEVVSEGPNHDRVYLAKVHFEGIWGVGKGRSKKVAEINAARKVINEMMRLNILKTVNSSERGDV